jgi:GNAT superfamily N-acetyltransferase
MHVRKTRNLDIVRRLDEKIFKDNADEELTLRNTTWWLAYVDGKIAGFAGLKVFREGTHKMGFLERAGVLPEYRGQGIQRLLIDVRDREARRQMVDQNITYVADWNLSSANNLIRCGYELYKPERKFGIKDALYFWKPFKYRSK